MWYYPSAKQNTIGLFKWLQHRVTCLSALCIHLKCGQARLQLERVLVARLWLTADSWLRLAHRQNLLLVINWIVRAGLGSSLLTRCLSKLNQKQWMTKCYCEHVEVQHESSLLFNKQTSRVSLNIWLLCSDSIDCATVGHPTCKTLLLADNRMCVCVCQTFFDQNHQVYTLGLTTSPKA